MREGHGRATKLLALGFLAAGIILNEWIIRSWFHDGPFWSVEQRLATWAVQLSLLSLGFILLRRTKQSFLSRCLASAKKYPRLAAFLFGLLPVAALAISVPVVLRMLRPADAVQTQILDLQTGEQRKGFTREDLLLGYQPVEDLSVQVQSGTESQTIYDVRYSFDQYGRRTTPANDLDRSDRFALFVGGSFTFGEGVNDHETLPASFGTLNPEIQAYNYGFSGYGTQQMLALLQGRDLRQEIEHSSGCMVYVYLDFHVQRVIGSFKVVSSWGAFMPYYRVDQSGKLKRFGNFTSGRPMTSLWYWFAHQLGLGSRFGFNHPPRRPEHLELTARIVKESQELFLERFPGSRFVVLLYPTPNRGKAWVRLLDDSQIEYLDYRDLYDRTADEFRITGDGHPTPQAYRIIATQLSNDLEDRNSRDKEEKALTPGRTDG